MEYSNEIDKLAPALVAIQEEMTVVKNAEGVHNAKYATLGAILLTIRPALKENGLTVFQTMRTDDKVVECTTMILHESGQWMKSLATVTAGGLSPQLFGGAISYVRRYGISAALSIATPDDDDDCEKIERAYTKAEEKERAEKELQKYRGAVIPRMMKFDVMALQEAFESSGYCSEEDEKEPMLMDLLKQANSKEKIIAIGREAKRLSDEVDKSLTTED